jgi:tetratricopeptide (TPR) repeat protein
VLFSYQAIKMSILGSSTDGGEEQVAIQSDDLPPFPTLGIRWSMIDEILELLGGRDDLAEKSTTDVCEILKAITKPSSLSLCGHLLLSKPDMAGAVTEAKWFVSHAWNGNFLDAMEAIGIFMEKEYPDPNDRDEAVVWFDLFSNSQHDTQNKPFEWFRDTFKNAIGKLGKVLMILEPWDNPVALTRAWCVMELHLCQLTESRFEVSMSKREANRFTAMLTNENTIANFHKMLSQVNSSKSEAREPEDKERIHAAIRSMLRQGFSDLDSRVLRTFEKWMYSTVEARIAVEADPVLVRKLKLCLAELLQCQGHLSEALQVAHELWESCDDKRDYFSLQCESCLANIYYRLGRYRDAEVRWQHCVECRNITGFVNNLAMLYQAQGKYDQAGNMFERVLAMRRATLGNNHADTLLSINSFGVLQVARGNYSSAELLFQECLDIGKILYSEEEHPEIIEFINNLANVHQAQGKYESARQHYEHCLRVRERIFGPDHSYTLDSLSNLAYMLQVQGKYDEAEQLCRQCLEKRINTVGREHPNTIGSMNNLANLLLARAKYDEAEELLVRCKTTLMITHGTEIHSDILNICNTLASVFKAQCKFDEAGRLYQQCIDGWEKIWGREHPHSLLARGNLATLYADQGKSDEALPLHKFCLETAERVLGTEHPDTLRYSNNLAHLYQGLDMLKLAESLFQRGLDTSTRVLGDEHPGTLLAYNNMAGLYMTQQKFADAEPMFKHCVKERSKVLGTDHPDTLTSIHDLGCCFKELNKYDEAESELLRSLDARKRVLGSDHVSTLSSHESLASLYAAQGDKEEAQQLLQRCYDARKRIYGSDNIAALKVANRLAEVLLDRGKYYAAEQLLQPLLSIAIRTFGEEHKVTLGMSIFLQFAYRCQGNHCAAVQLSDQFAERRKRYMELSKR